MGGRSTSRLALHETGTSVSLAPTSHWRPRRSVTARASRLRTACGGPLSTTGPPKLVRLITRMNIGGPARHVTILTARCGPEFAGFLLAGAPQDREGSLVAEAA